MKKFLLAIGMLMALMFAPQASFAQVSVGVAINLAPPPLPVYQQPPIPGPNYIWTPGYWAYANGDYYWVPGTWVLAPQIGFLWTPGYWGWGPGGYIFHAGYWGPHIGFYGGINYGFGYGGSGYQGGRWDHGQFAYNRSVNNITNTTVIHNVYDERVTNISNTRVSFNGGNGGIHAEPNAAEREYANGPHLAPTSVQEAHMHAAASDRNQFASVNHGAPPVAATPRPGALRDAGVVRASPAAHMEAAPAEHGGNPPHAGAAQPPHAAGGQHGAAPAAAHQANHAAPNQQAHAVSNQQTHAAPHPQAHQEPHPQAHQEAHPQAHPGGGHAEEHRQ